MIISTCGFGSTGSSAVSDYLGECENVQVLDSLEFSISGMVDGLEDLEYHLMKKYTRQCASVYAIQRFRKAMYSKAKGFQSRTGIPVQTVKDLTDCFLQEISQLEYVSFSPMIDKDHSELCLQYIGKSLIQNRLLKKLERNGILKKNIDIYPFDTVQVAIRPTNFYEAAQKFVSGLLSAMGADLSKVIVLDQAFSGSDPTRSFPFYMDPYAVIVDRDPRDLYIFAKKFLLSMGRFIPTDNVDNFIIYYKLIHQGKERRKNNDRILNLHFEELVYDYESATHKINVFLKLKNGKPKSIFKPEMSMANTNLSQRFPEFKNDIKKIENELSEYLFDFSKYDTSASNGKMFYGRAKQPKFHKNS